MKSFNLAEWALNHTSLVAVLAIIFVLTVLYEYAKARKTDPTEETSQ